MAGRSAGEPGGETVSLVDGVFMGEAGTEPLIANTHTNHKP